MLHKSHCVFLLFTGGVDVCQEEGYIVTADEGHQARVIKLVHSGLLLPPICCLVCLLTLVDGFVGDFWSIPFCWFATLNIDPLPNVIYLVLRQQVGWIIEVRAITCRPGVTVVKVPVGRAVNVPTSE
jgi:hypothetical protein